MNAFKNTNTSGMTEFITIFIANQDTTLTLNDKLYHLAFGNIILARENISFRYEKDITVLCFKEKFFDTIFYSQISDCKVIFDFFQIKNPQNEILFFDYDDTAPTYQSAKILEVEISHFDSYKDKLVRLYCVALLTHLQQYHHAHLVVNLSTMNEQHCFGKILKYIGDHYATVTLKELSELFGYNQDYLSYLFKKITSQTFKEKLLEIRLEQATRFLKHSDLKVEEISLQVGFKDKSYFMRKFKERYNTTPAKYRKENLNNQL